MTKLEFTSSVIDSLAWPLVILIIVIILRKPIIKIFSNLNKLSYNNLEMNFPQKLENIETKIDEKEMHFGDNTVNQISTTDKVKERDILTVAKISPAAAITMAWSMVEQEILSTIYRLAISPDPPRHNSPFKNISLLTDAGMLDFETQMIFNELREIRNKVVHPHPSTENITYYDAEKYYELAIKAINILKSIER